MGQNLVFGYERGRRVLGYHEARIDAARWHQEGRQIAQRRRQQAEGPSFRDAAHLGHGTGQVVHDETDWFAVEVATRHDTVVENERVVGDGVQLPFDHRSGMMPVVERGSEYLGCASQAVRILNLFTVSVGRSDFAGTQQGSQMPSDFYLPWMGAGGVDTRIEGAVGTAQGFDGHGGYGGGGLKERPRLDQSEGCDGTHDRRAVDQGEPLLRGETDGMQSGTTQCLAAGHSPVMVQGFPFTEQDETQVGQRREVAAGAEGPLFGNDGDHIGGEQVEQGIDEVGTDPRHAAGERVRSQQDGGADERRCQRRTDADGVGSYQIDLQALQVGARDTDAGEITEAGIDAVQRFVARQQSFDDPSVDQASTACCGGEADGNGRLGGHASDHVDVEIGSIDDETLHERTPFEGRHHTTASLPTGRRAQYDTSRRSDVNGCKACGYGNDPGVLFCHQCGAQLERHSRESIERQKHAAQCPTCDYYNPIESQNCNRCGADLRAQSGVMVRNHEGRVSLVRLAKLGPVGQAFAWAGFLALLAALLAMTLAALSDTGNLGAFVVDVRGQLLATSWILVVLFVAVEWQTGPVYRLKTMLVIVLALLAASMHSGGSDLRILAWSLDRLLAVSLFGVLLFTVLYTVRDRVEGSLFAVFTAFLGLYCSVAPIDVVFDGGGFTAAVTYRAPFIVGLPFVVGPAFLTFHLFLPIVFLHMMGNTLRSYLRSMERVDGTKSIVRFLNRRKEEARGELLNLFIVGIQLHLGFIIMQQQGAPNLVGLILRGWEMIR